MDFGNYFEGYHSVTNLKAKEVAIYEGKTEVVNLDSALVGVVYVDYSLEDFVGLKIIHHDFGQRLFGFAFLLQRLSLNLNYILVVFLVMNEMKHCGYEVYFG